MLVDGIPTRTIWPTNHRTVGIIDQTKLPHTFEKIELKTLEGAATAIKTMQVRGAPLIGATAAYGIALALAADSSDASLAHAIDILGATRPTAVNLRWALHRLRDQLLPLDPNSRASTAWTLAAQLCEEDITINRAIAQHGLPLIKPLHHTDRSRDTDDSPAKAVGACSHGRISPSRPPSPRDGKPINILTHCNAGWLCAVDVGTATAPIYAAHDAGIPIHVWVDETRPRNQGASLTAWELAHHGVPHTVIADNTGGHLMQHHLVDLIIVGTDRTTSTGDVANKIGTYLKALAAKDNNIPFYVALPSPSIDWTIADGIREIPIEQRDAKEVQQITGRAENGTIITVTLTPKESPAANYAFDVTPARLVTALITERGVCPASREGLLSLFPEKR
jgi:methylthioribose-1-phosphate isomerase